MNLAGEGFDVGQCSRGRLTAAGKHHHVGLPDCLACPGRGLVAAEIDHERRGVFELVEPFCNFMRIERASRKHRLQAGGVDDLGMGRGQPLAHPSIEGRGQRLDPATDQRHRPRLRRGAERSDTRGLPGEALRQRGEQCLDDRRRLGDELLIGCPCKCQHAGIANGDHVGGARHVGEEADLADQLAGAKLGDRLVKACLAHRERAMQHEEKRIRRPSLRDQHLPAHQILADHGVERLQALFGTERPEQREVFQRRAPGKDRARPTHLAVSIDTARL